jgi:hypothetical protein
MPAIIDAYVTKDEMCDALLGAWVIWRETPVF